MQIIAAKKYLSIIFYARQLYRQVLLRERVLAMGILSVRLSVRHDPVRSRWMETPLYGTGWPHVRLCPKFLVRPPGTVVRGGILFYYRCFTSFIFGQLQNLIANISGTENAVDKLKPAL